MSEPEEILRVSDVRKSFGNNEVLHGGSLSLRRGDVLSVIGPSGGGKSTLLRCTVNLEPVTSGSIRIGGDDLVKDGVYAPKAVQRRILLRIGLVFQQFNLFPHFSVLRNVTEAQRVVLGRSREQATAHAMDLLDKMGLAGKADAYPHYIFYLNQNLARKSPKNVVTLIYMESSANSEKIKQLIRK